MTNENVESKIIETDRQLRTNDKEHTKELLFIAVAFGVIILFSAIGFMDQSAKIDELARKLDETSAVDEPLSHTLKEGKHCFPTPNAANTVRDRALYVAAAQKGSNDIRRSNYRLGELFKAHVFSPGYNIDELNANFSSSEAIRSQQNGTQSFSPVPEVTDTTEIDNSYCFDVKWPFGDEPDWVQK